MAGNCVLVQFAREPLPGRVKTRLMPFLTAEQACELHIELVQWCARQLLAANLGEVQLHVAGSLNHEVFRSCRRDGVNALLVQSEGDLGERMLFALQQVAFPARKVLLTGSDCPDMTPAYLQRASRALDHHALVIGPAKDGGFVLIGARIPANMTLSPDLFSAVSWGGDDVFDTTMANVRRLGIDCHVLPVLADIDRPEDLLVWERIRNGAAT